MAHIQSHILGLCGALSKHKNSFHMPHTTEKSSAETGTCMSLVFPESKFKAHNISAHSWEHLSACVTGRNFTSSVATVPTVSCLIATLQEQIHTINVTVSKLSRRPGCKRLCVNPAYMLCKLRQWRSMVRDDVVNLVKRRARDGDGQQPASTYVTSRMIRLLSLGFWRERKDGYVPPECWRDTISDLGVQICKIWIWEVLVTLPNNGDVEEVRGHGMLQYQWTSSWYQARLEFRIWQDHKIPSNPRSVVYTIWDRDECSTNACVDGIIGPVWQRLNFWVSSEAFVFAFFYRRELHSGCLNTSFFVLRLVLLTGATALYGRSWRWCVVGRDGRGVVLHVEDR